MRQSPIGIACAGRPARAAAWARRDAAMTHPDPVCLAASSAYAAAIAAGVGGADSRAMWAEAHACAGGDDGGARVRHWLAGTTAEGPGEYVHQMGWARIAFVNAFHRLWVGQPLEQALVETVGCGGDTDTNAAICGAQLGAAQGGLVSPGRWRRAILGCRAVTAPGVRHPRPAAYWADDAMDLAEALLDVAMR